MWNTTIEPVYRWGYATGVQTYANQDVYRGDWFDDKRVNDVWEGIKVRCVPVCLCVYCWSDGVCACLVVGLADVRLSAPLRPLLITTLLLLVAACYCFVAACCCLLLLVAALLLLVTALLLHYCDHICSITIQDLCKSRCYCEAKCQRSYLHHSACCEIATQALSKAWTDKALALVFMLMAHATSAIFLRINAKVKAF